MGMCIFKYVFNIKLAIPENEGLYVSYKGNKVLIRVKSINGSNISSFTSEDVSWLTKRNGKDDNNILRINEVNRNKKTPVRYIHFPNSNDIFSGGVVEPTKFSIFEVCFKVNNKKYLDNEENFNNLKKLSSEVINQFINKYRLISGDNDIYLPDPHESPVIEVWYSDNVEQDGEFISANLQLYKRTVHFNGLDNPNINILSEDKLDKLNDLLKDDSEIPLYQQLLLEAKEQGHMRNNYELAILKTCTSFEVYLQELLIEYCQLLNIEKLPVGKGNNLEKLPTKNYKEAILEGKIIDDLLKKYLKMIIGNNSVLSVKEYNHWHSKAYTIRNEIVHSGRRNVSEDEAKLAFESTNNLIALISGKIKEKF